MTQADIDAAIARGQAAAAVIERTRADLEAAMLAVLPIVGTQGLKTLVAGVELGVVMRWCGAMRRD